VDPTLNWSTNAESTTAVPSLTSESSVVISLSNVGLGYQNSVEIVAQGNDVTTAAGKARAYSGNSLNDWYLPDNAEFNLLMQWAYGETPTPGTGYTVGSTLNSSTYGASSAGIINSTRYWTSSQVNASNAWAVNPAMTSASAYPKIFSSLWYVRAIRAF
jgi:hypothetical protein